jgi:hypothetical protein
MVVAEIAAAGAAAVTERFPASAKEVLSGALSIAPAEAGTQKSRSVLTSKRSGAGDDPLCAVSSPTSTLMPIKMDGGMCKRGCASQSVIAHPIDFAPYAL